MQGALLVICFFGSILFAYLGMNSYPGKGKGYFTIWAVCIVVYVLTGISIPGALYDAAGVYLVLSGFFFFVTIITRNTEQTSFFELILLKIFGFLVYKKGEEIRFTRLLHLDNFLNIENILNSMGRELKGQSEIKFENGILNLNQTGEILESDASLLTCGAYMKQAEENWNDVRRLLLRHELLKDNKKAKLEYCLAGYSIYLLTLKQNLPKEKAKSRIDWLLLPIYIDSKYGKHAEFIVIKFMNLYEKLMKSKLKEELFLDAVYDETSLELFRMITGEDLKGDISEKITKCIKDSLKKTVEHVQEIDSNTNEYFEILDDDTLHERIGKVTSSNALLFIKRREKA